LGLGAYETDLIEFVRAKHVANLIAQCSTIEVQLFELITG
jgi:hypothetical protein